MADKRDEMDFWTMERDFWLEGLAFFERHMADDAAMVFPEPTGELRGAEILEALKGGPRWAEVTFDDPVLAREPHGVMLSYTAKARRDGRPPYEAFCESTYARIGTEWKLTTHRQTPV
jgi:hypothetical protein